MYNLYFAPVLAATLIKMNAIFHTQIWQSCQNLRFLAALLAYNILTCSIHQTNLHVFPFWKAPDSVTSYLLLTVIDRFGLDQLRVLLPVLIPFLT